MNVGKKVHILTWGCQMNVYDSQRMADVLQPMGYTSTDVVAEADLVILNTCHIREKATEKVFSELGRLRPVKAAREAIGKKTLLAVAGCVAQAEGEVITQRAKYVDMIFGTQTYHRLPEMVAQAEKNVGMQRLINTEFPIEAKFDELPLERHDIGTSGFLAIQEGCDKFCTFCVVPYTRGAEYSRPADKILAEARQLVAKGAKEITLLGQNVNAWHGDGLASGSTWNLGQLLFALAEIDGVQRLRYMTSHPRDMHELLYRAHAEIPAMMPYMHLPIQSGSDKILTAMNRKHTRNEYFAIIDRLRAARPDMAFSSDFIIGYPGETTQDFMDTMDLIKRVQYAAAYSFKYSPRPGTPAAKQMRQVKEEVKSERLQQLQSLLFSQQQAFNSQFIGQTVPVLFDRLGRTDTQLHGRTPWQQAIHVDAPAELMHTIADVQVTAATSSSLVGQLVALKNAA